MDEEYKNFSIWLFRERGWIKGDAGRKIGSGYDEPAAAADAAEDFLKRVGVPGQSYAELRFNGEFKPHTVVCYMDEGSFGIWNTESVKWPIYYPPDDHDDAMLSSFPFEEIEDGSHWNSEEGDMKLDEDQPEDQGDEEEEPEEDSGSDEEIDEDHPDDDDAGSDDSTDDDDDDSEDEDADAGEDDSPSEDDVMPRLRIFAKMRGAVGWRKRAEAEELNDKNTFIFKLGILDEDADKPSEQEREVFAQVQFVERDEDREAGTLRLKLPTVEDPISDFKLTNSGWLEFRVPYREEDNV